jgi:uncharacterized radical SAM protein YgiQ
MSPVPTPPQRARPLTGYKPFWAKRFGPAPFLPMSRAEMEALGWDSCDVVLVTGDAYVDHPSFGMAVIGRVLEAQGFRVGIIAQPDWQSAEPFKALGRPNLFWGVTAGNMDSMINRYTADRKIRSDDAYTPGDVGGQRPDRAAIVYSQRCREAYKDVPIILGGIEGSLRRIAHYDYWSDSVRRSIVVDSKCDLLLYGNAERALVEIAHRLARREPVAQITDVRGTAFVRRASDPGWREIDSTEVDRPGRVDALANPYQTTAERAAGQGTRCDAIKIEAASAGQTSADAPKGIEKPIALIRPDHARTVIRLPGYEQVRRDPVLYAHANRVLHLETNPGNARALVQAHGEGRSARDVWINPPPIPLSTAEMDHIFDLPYARNPHPRYADERGRHDGATKIPAWEMIRFSVNIMRGCFGGCTFCSITEHEGRIIQSRSEDSIAREVEAMRDQVQGFTGVVSDLGGPTANMYRLGCRDPAIEAACRKPSCVYPGICPNLGTDHDPLIRVYRRVRQLPGVKKVLIGSGLRYDLAIRSPAYVKELVQHHVGGYLKIAPEHTEEGPLSKMMKPGIGNYDRFKQLFDQYSAEAIARRAPRRCAASPSWRVSAWASPTSTSSLRPPQGQAGAGPAICADAGRRPDGEGKLILVTAISPTPAGEGKTTTTVGLGDALNLIGKKAHDGAARALAGPGVRHEGRRHRRRPGAGGADGGHQPALHRRLPRHRAGQQPAGRGTLDNHIHHGNALDIDVRRITGGAWWT